MTGTGPLRPQKESACRRVRLQHERITVTRNGQAEAVLLSVDDLEGLETTLDILGDRLRAAAQLATSRRDCHDRSEGTAASTTTPAAPATTAA